MVRQFYSDNDAPMCGEHSLMKELVELSGDLIGLATDFSPPGEYRSHWAFAAFMYIYNLEDGLRFDTLTLEDVRIALVRFAIIYENREDFEWGIAIAHECIKAIERFQYQRE